MKYRINLIFSKKEQRIERFFYFIYNYLRYIIVITQIVVIFVFFNKIKYDQEIIDLQEIISQQKEIIDISQPLIKEYLLIKKKVNKAEEIFHSQELLINQINYLSSIFPKGASLNQMKYEKGSFMLLGNAIDPILIKAFYNKIKKDNFYQNVVLEKIEKKEFSYSFTIRLNNFKLK